MNQPRLWIGRNSIAAMEAEAALHAPLESGGVLLGYWDATGTDAVATHVVGPGPCARHHKERFAPDHEYQLAEIARFYEESGRSLQYLGDWHTHPCGSGNLSAQDRVTAGAIARSRTARAPHPVMLVLAGGPVWELHGWRYRRQRRLLWTQCVVESLAVSVFEPSSL